MRAADYFGDSGHRRAASEATTAGKMPALQEAAALAAAEWRFDVTLSFGEGDSDADIAKARGSGAVSCAHGLLRLSFATIRRAPQS
ncbi:MAG: hypothetical protein ACRD4Q_11230, partial [Candidatus Acidiferrales bacterium]